MVEGWLSDGKAYYCFCSPEQLDAERQAALAAGLPPKYGGRAGRCRWMSHARVWRRARRLRSGFACPRRETSRSTTSCVGEVTFSTDVIGDPVIVRSDGRPAYNFAVVVDDVQMAITHVIRGEDHISNTPRQVLLYEALGASPPEFAHLSLVLGPDHAPLSKRHGATSVAEFRERGYLPEALVNYLALLGWSPGSRRKCSTPDEMARRFDLAKVSHSAAVFDIGEARLDEPALHEGGRPGPDRAAARSRRLRGRATSRRRPAYHWSSSSRSLPMAVGSVDRLEEIPERVAFVFEWDAARAVELVRAEPDGRAGGRGLPRRRRPRRGRWIGTRFGRRRRARGS